MRLCRSELERRCVEDLDGVEDRLARAGFLRINGIGITSPKWTQDQHALIQGKRE